MSIQVHNVHSGDTVTYSLPLLVGDVKPPLAQGTILVHNADQGVIHKWPVFQGHFKALVPLQQGKNIIHFKFYEEVYDLVLNYCLPDIVRYVRPVYIQCCDDEGLFQGPEDEDCTPQSAQKRIALGAKLLQTFTAEKIREHGLGAKTFLLETDLYPSQPECHLFTSRLMFSEAHSMSGGDLWTHYAKELMSSKQFSSKENCKWLAFMSFTRYQPPNGVTPKSHSEVLKYTKGFTALGGGGLALCGTGTLHCWADSLEKLIPCFTDTRKMDKTKLMDDSAYREFYWANYSTGLGASLHELGHTFDLAHTPTGVMARGFDDFYRVFTVQPLLPRSSLYSNINSSHVSSPIPYSPKQSPVHKPKPDRSRSRSGSPRPSPLSRPTPPVAPFNHTPLTIIQIEPAFKKLKVTRTKTCIRNYDESETERTTVKYPDGTEMISEMTVFADGERTLKETLNNVASGKSRTTISLSTSCPRSHPPAASHTTKPCSLPRSPEESSSVQRRQPGATAFSFQETRYKDGGAHWYRSSAVLLNYHKWFNILDAPSSKSLPQINGNVVQVDAGVRLIELRSVPEGVVFHHWEFLQDTPPVRFRLRHSEVLQLSQGCSEVGILVLDHHGNIVKKRIVTESLKTKKEDVTHASGQRSLSEGSEPRGLERAVAHAPNPTVTHGAASKPTVTHGAASNATVTHRAANNSS